MTTSLTVVDEQFSFLAEINGCETFFINCNNSFEYFDETKEIMMNLYWISFTSKLGFQLSVLADLLAYKNPFWAKNPILCISFLIPWFSVIVYLLRQGL